MKNRRPYKILILALSWIFLAAGASQAWEGMGDMEAQLLARLNQARIAPAKAVSELGLEMERVLNCNPFFEDWMDEGVVEFSPDERLFSAATHHAEEMAAEHYFSNISTDGSGPEDRFRDALYAASSYGEVLGVVLFQRYLAKEDALSALYKNIIENDLACDSGLESRVFNPDFKEIGLSIRSGSIVINGTRLNFYLAVVDFGSDSFSIDEKRLLLSLNSARREPDMFPVDVLPQYQFAYLSEYMSGQPKESGSREALAPMAYDMVLSLKAENALKERITGIVGSATGGLGEGLNNGVSVPEDFQSAEITKIWMTLEEKSVEEVRAFLLQKALVEDALRAPEDRVLLNSDYTAAGMAMVSLPVVFADGNEYFFHAMVIEAGTISGPEEKIEFSGILYVDQDADTQVSSGEGVGSMPVVISGDRENLVVFTGELGEFALFLEPGEYRMSYGGDPGTIEFTETVFEVAEMNSFIIQAMELVEKQR